MSLGVLNNIAAIYAENNLNQTQSSLQKTLTQLSSGSRINSGADDAAGLSIVNGLQANVSALTQSTQNASDGIGLLQTADGALSQVTNLLNRAVTLATEAANGTLNTNQVSSANQEYQNILTEIGNIGSTTNFNGNSVFTATAKTVFVSDGTANGANSYSETVGVLGKGSVGQSGSTAGVLATPTATAPTATTSLQPAATVATPSTISVLPASTSAVGTTSAATSTALYSGASSNVSSTTGSVTYGSPGTGYAGLSSLSTGTLNTSNGATFSPSTATASVSGGFTTSDSYTGTIGVQTAGSSTIYSATVTSGSLNDVVNALNSSFGYSSANGTFGSSGLKAASVNNALVITSNGTGASSQVIVDDPVNALQVTNGGGTHAVSFSGTANQATVSGAQSNTYTLSSLGSDGLNGTLNIYSGNGAGASTSPVASINFGSDTAGTTAANAQTTIDTALSGTGYSAVYSASGGGSLTITGPASLTSGFSVGSGTGAQSFQAATAADASTSAPLGTPLPTTSSTALASTYTATSLTAAPGTGSLGASDTYSGTIQVQLAGSNTTYSATASGSLSSLVTSLNSQFGSDGTNFGTAGLKASIVSNALVLTSAEGAGQVVVNGGQTTLKVNEGGNTSAQALTFAGTGSSNVVGGYTAAAPTPASASSASLTLGTGGTSDAAEGSLSVYSGAGGTGALVGTINFGTGTYGAAAIQSLVNTASSSFASGFSASYTGGHLVVTGPANGNAFSVTSATSGSNELQAGTVTPTVVGGTTVVSTSGTGVAATASTVYNGTISFGTSGQPGSGSYAIPTAGLSESNAASLTALNSALTSASSGITASFAGHQLTFTSSSATAPTIALSNATASDAGVTTYSSSTASFSPTSANGTFGGTLSVGTGTGTGSDGGIALISSTIAAGSSLTSVVSQLNTQYQTAGVQTNNAGTLTGLVASAGADGSLVITGPTPANNASGAVATADKLTFGATTNLSTATGSTETLSNANASSGTTYSGTISFGAVGTTGAGSYSIQSGQTAAQIAAALNTSQYLGTASTGVQASVNSSNQLVFTGPSSGSAEGSGPGVTLTNVVAVAPTVTTYSQSTAAFAPTNTGGTFSGTISVGTVGSTAVSTTVAAGTTLSNLVTQLNNQYLTAGNGIVASAGTGSQAGQLILTGPATAANASAGTAANNQLTFGSSTNLVASGGATSGVDFTQSSISTLTASSAQTVLTSLTTAINDVAYQRGIIGADVNELTAASNVASSESVNLTSAQSSIQSTDYGATTSNLAKYQVLSQTGISALAQANSVQQEVLKLLQ